MLKRRGSFASALVDGTPWVIVAAWLIAGQWELSGGEAHAWVRLAVPIAVACLVPVTGRWPRGETLVRRLRWVGWAIVAGLLVTT